MCGMLVRLQAQVRDITAMVTVDLSLASSIVTLVSMVRTEPRPVASSVETEVSMYP